MVDPIQEGSPIVRHLHPIRHHPRTSAFVIAASAIAAISLLPVMIPLGSGLALHRTCIGGAPLATVSLWTPISLLNAPYDGSGTAVAVLASSGERVVTVSTTALNGGANGEFSLDNWTVETAIPSIAVGPGPNEYCTAPYLASDLSRGGQYYASNYVAGMDLLPSNSTTDAFEPHQVNITGLIWTGHYETFTSVVFNNSFEPDASIGVSVCGAQAGEFPSTIISSRLTVSIPFTLGTRTLLVAAELHTSVTYTYSVNATAQGVWRFDELNGVGFSGGGAAFSWNPCPG